MLAIRNLTEIYNDLHFSHTPNHMCIEWQHDLKEAAAKQIRNQSWQVDSCSLAAYLSIVFAAGN
jgi:hypothetical protein